MANPGWNSAYSPLGSPDERGGALGSNEQEHFMGDIGSEQQRYYDISPEISSSHRFSIPRRPIGHRDSTQSTSSLLEMKAGVGNDSRNSTFTLQGFQIDEALERRNDSSQLWHPKKQFFDLFKWSFLRFLSTVVLAVGLYLTLFKFSADAALDDRQKHAFNFIFTALSMMLGVNIAAAFKHLAIDARWWFLSRKQRPLSEVELLLNCHSQTSVLRLGLRTWFKYPGTAAFCAFWLIVNLGAQVMVAMISLNFTIGVPVPDYSRQVAGQVQYTNMSQLYYGFRGSEGAEGVTAHALGDAGASYAAEFSIEDIPSRQPPVRQFDASPRYSYFSATTYSQHVFLDSPADSNAAATIGTFISNRSVLVNSSCFTYPTYEFDLDAGTVAFVNATNQNQTVSWGFLKADSTMYGLRWWLNEEFSLGECGPRCGAIDVFENQDGIGNYYLCNVTVGQVANTTQPGQQINDTTAQILAQSIALAGENYEQRYPSDFFFGTYLYGNATTMAYMLRTFTTGAITIADQLNPNIDTPVDDFIPLLATQLSLDHPENIRGVLFGIIGGHLIMMIAGLFIANRVVVTDDSALATARVLRPVVDQLGTQGSLLDADEICVRLGDPNMVYGPSIKERRATGDVVRHLEISEKAAVKRKVRDWKGKYD